MNIYTHSSGYWNTKFGLDERWNSGKCIIWWLGLKSTIFATDNWGLGYTHASECCGFGECVKSGVSVLIRCFFAAGWLSPASNSSWPRFWPAPPCGCVSCWGWLVNINIHDRLGSLKVAYTHKFACCGAGGILLCAGGLGFWGLVGWLLKAKSSIIFVADHGIYTHTSEFLSASGFLLWLLLKLGGKSLIFVTHNCQWIYTHFSLNQISNLCYGYHHMRQSRRWSLNIYRDSPF